MKTIKDYLLYGFLSAIFAILGYINFESTILTLLVYSITNQIIKDRENE